MSNFTKFLIQNQGKKLEEMTNREIYYNLLEYVKKESDAKNLSSTFSLPNGLT